VFTYIIQKVQKVKIFVIYEGFIKVIKGQLSIIVGKVFLLVKSDVKDTVETPYGNG
jgi:hypothetical protein